MMANARTRRSRTLARLVAGAVAVVVLAGAMVLARSMLVRQPSCDSYAHAVAAHESAVRTVMPESVLRVESFTPCDDSTSAVTTVVKLRDPGRCSEFSSEMTRFFEVNSVDDNVEVDCVDNAGAMELELASAART